MKLGLKLKSDNLFTPSKGVGYSAEAQALFARITTPPTDARKTLINSMIVSLISAGVWPKLDALYIMAAADSQAAKLNWIANQYNLTEVNAPTFTADRGYAGDGSTNYLTATMGTLANFSLNTGTISIGIQAFGGAAGAFEIVLGNARIQLNAGPTTFQGRVNDAASSNALGAPGVGRLVANRTGASARSFFKNGVSVGTDATAVTTLSTTTLNILSAGASAYSTETASYAYVGALSDTQVIAADAALNTYLTAVGAA